MNAARKPPYRVIDADGHVTETPALYELWASRLPPQYRSQAPGWREEADGTRRWMVEDKVWPNNPLDRVGQYTKPEHMWASREGEHDPHKRMPDMEFMGIDVSVLYCSSVIHVPAIVEDPALAAAVSRVYNDWIAEYCAAYPDRLKGIAMVPVQDPAEAALELRRAVKLGLVGALFPPLFGATMLGSDYFHPIYAAAQEMNVPICIHTNTSLSPAKDLFDSFLLRHAYSSFPMMMALGSIVAGGVLDIFPRLRFAFLETGGGWVPYVMERIQDRASVLPKEVAGLKKTPAEYIKGDQLYYSVEPHELTAAMVAQIVGEERFVMGSDYAHWDGSSPESVRTVLGREDMSEGLKKKILSDNPSRLYNL